MTLKSQSAGDIDEKAAFFIPGIIALIMGLISLAIFGHFIWQNLVTDPASPPLFTIGGAVFTFWAMTRGMVVLEPKQALVLTFFGKYAGTIRRDGFFWFNPLNRRHRLSLRVVNMTTPTLKVNDFSGNPIEVAAVVV